MLAYSAGLTGLIDKCQAMNLPARSCFRTGGLLDEIVLHSKICGADMQVFLYYSFRGVTPPPLLVNHLNLLIDQGEL